MKFSKSFIQTLKEVPNDVDQDNPSQILMARAGLIKRMSNGLYVHMPMMISLMQKVETEIRRAMATVDCAEVKFPVLVTKPDLVESGRWEAFGKEIFKLKDRNDKDMALSPTNEEAACFMARSHIQSHNQLPLCLFQIQKKYRDEISSRGGVMRTKEFTMKDAYSFHATDDCLNDYFLKMQKAYSTLFKNLGLSVIHVTADNGAMGGNGSREFMVISECGTDTVAVCKCGFAANIETIGEKKTCSCNSPFEFHKAYEIGHIFALGTYYSKKLDLNYVDENGKPQILHMGCYGIGVERIVAAIIEQYHDSKGIAFPEYLAPVKYNVITINMDDKTLVKQSEREYKKLVKKYGDSAVIWDDRKISAGVKLKDSDLLGIPNKVVVSTKGVSNEKRN